jgi:menaquinol-cytochrome c reductase iron-sulfur subunit
MIDTSMRRRRFLAIWTAGLVALLGGLIVGPAVAFVLNPLRRKGPAEEEDFVDAGRLDALAVGKWTLVPIEIVRQDGWSKHQQSRSVWVLRSPGADEETKVFSPICTHLGCPIALSPDGKGFACPCHGGVYSNEGTHVAGPPPRDMDPLEFKVKNGHLLVRWQDFKISVPERIAVQV